MLTSRRCCSSDRVVNARRGSLCSTLWRYIPCLLQSLFPKQPVKQQDLGTSSAALRSRIAESQIMELIGMAPSKGTKSTDSNVDFLMLGRIPRIVFFSTSVIVRDGNNRFSTSAAPSWRSTMATVMLPLSLKSLVPRSLPEIVQFLHGLLHAPTRVRHARTLASTREILRRSRCSRR